MNFPKMPLDAALQFAFENHTTGGLTTKLALETLASEVIRLQAVDKTPAELKSVMAERIAANLNQEWRSDSLRMNWLSSLNRVDYCVGYWKSEELETLRERLDRIMPLYPMSSLEALKEGADSRSTNRAKSRVRLYYRKTHEETGCVRDQAWSLEIWQSGKWNPIENEHGVILYESKEKAEAAQLAFSKIT
jgi:hypothetical protein